MQLLAPRLSESSKSAEAWQDVCCNCLVGATTGPRNDKIIIMVKRIATCTAVSPPTMSSSVFTEVQDCPTRQDVSVRTTEVPALTIHMHELVLELPYCATEVRKIRE